MRDYMRRRRLVCPAIPMVERARRRAQQRCVPFAITSQTLVIPSICPALGIPLILSGKRCEGSPSLDRIVPHQGYVEGNVRVISDRANRIKGDRTLQELRFRATLGEPELRRDYALIAAYVDRELLLAEVRQKARQGGRSGAEWARLALALDRLFGRHASGEIFNTKEVK
jgi:hypothetical protein